MGTRRVHVKGSVRHEDGKTIRVRPHWREIKEAINRTEAEWDEADRRISEAGSQQERENAIRQQRRKAAKLLELQKEATKFDTGKVHGPTREDMEKAERAGKKYVGPLTAHTVVTGDTLQHDLEHEQAVLRSGLDAGLTDRQMANVRRRIEGIKAKLENREPRRVIPKVGESLKPAVPVDKREAELRKRLVKAEEDLKVAKRTGQHAVRQDRERTIPILKEKLAALNVPEIKFIKKKDARGEAYVSEDGRFRITKQDRPNKNAAKAGFSGRSHVTQGWTVERDGMVTGHASSLKLAKEKARARSAQEVAKSKEPPRYVSKGSQYVPDELRFEMEAILAIDSGADTPEAKAFKQLFAYGPENLTGQEKKLVKKELKAELGQGGLMHREGGTSKSREQIKKLQRQGKRVLAKLDSVQVEQRHEEGRQPVGGGRKLFAVQYAGENFTRRSEKDYTHAVILNRPSGRKVRFVEGEDKAKQVAGRYGHVVPVTVLAGAPVDEPRKGRRMRREADKETRGKMVSPYSIELDEIAARKQLNISEVAHISTTASNFEVNLLRIVEKRHGKTESRRLSRAFAKARRNRISSMTKDEAVTTALPHVRRLEFDKAFMSDNPEDAYLHLIEQAKQDLESARTERQKEFIRKNVRRYKETLAKIRKEKGKSKTQPKTVGSGKAMKDVTTGKSVSQPKPSKKVSHETDESLEAYRQKLRDAYDAAPEPKKSKPRERKRLTPEERAIKNDRRRDIRSGRARPSKKTAKEAVKKWKNPVTGQPEDTRTRRQKNKGKTSFASGKRSKAQDRMAKKKTPKSKKASSQLSTDPRQVRRRERRAAAKKKGSKK